MAEEIISVTGIAEQGVVKDTPPVALSPNVFTDVRNVRFKDGAVRKITGELLQKILYQLMKSLDK